MATVLCQAILEGPEGLDWGCMGAIADGYWGRVVVCCMQGEPPPDTGVNMWDSPSCD